MQTDLVLPFDAPPLQTIEHPLLIKKDITVNILRLDLVHPAISGNKWFKLKYNLQKAEELRHSTLLTFGGAYSNHIYATAAAGDLFGFKTIGVIRGEEHLPLNPTLSFAVDKGMLLNYVNRTDYRKKNDPQFIDSLHQEFGDFYLIPEGGSNSLALPGVNEILSYTDLTFDYISLPVGTGGTVAGIITSLNNKKKIIGFPVLKGASFLYNDIFNLLDDTYTKYKNWTLSLDYHFGGYAKTNPLLNNFIKQFSEITSIPIEFVYTGKMFFGLFDMIKNNYFPAGTTILTLHTGGLRPDSNN